MRRVVYGVGVALAVSFVPVTIAIVLLALDDRDAGLAPIPRAVLTLGVLAGPVAGGAVIAPGARAREVRGLVGAIALGAITVFGLIRQAAGEHDAEAGLLVPAIILGALLGLLGGPLRALRPGRTRS